MTANLEGFSLSVSEQRALTEITQMTNDEVLAAFLCAEVGSYPDARIPSAESIEAAEEAVRVWSRKVCLTVRPQVLCTHTSKTVGVAS